ncbi:MAG: hypothetical protein ABL309_10325 [Phycisphaerales bacterium]
MPGQRGNAVWPIVIGVFCLLAVLVAGNFMLHALWMPGHPVEDGGERGEAWGRRATVWFGVVVVLVIGLGWSVWRVERWWRRRAERG